MPVTIDRQAFFTMFCRLLSARCCSWMYCSFPASDVRRQVKPDSIHFPMSTPNMAESVAAMYIFPSEVDKARQAKAFPPFFLIGREQIIFVVTGILFGCLLLRQLSFQYNFHIGSTEYLIKSSFNRLTKRIYYLICLGYTNRNGRGYLTTQIEYLF